MTWLATNWQTAAAALIVALTALGLLRGLLRGRRRPPCAACGGGKPCRPQQPGTRQRP